MRDDWSAAERLTKVRSAIAQAEERSGRSGTVTLVAVSKTVESSRILDVYNAGQRIFGENRVQEAVTKIATLRPSCPDARWHLIGHLQSNKARLAAQNFHVIQSVDSLDLAERLSRLGAQSDDELEVLFEINVAGESSKHGFSIDGLESRAADLLALPHLKPIGLMTIAPLAADPEDVRPVFRRLRELRDSMRETHALPDFEHLSMGMSGDFEVAIEEGATMVRIGRAIFGERPKG